MQNNNDKRIGQVVTFGMVLSTAGALCLNLKAAGVVLLLWASLFLVYATILVRHPNDKQPSPRAHTEN